MPQWLIYLAILLLAAVVMMALAPKPKPPEPGKGQTPEVKDGRAVREVFGTVWIDDPTIVGWHNGDPEPIRRRAGKK